MAKVHQLTPKTKSIKLTKFDAEQAKIRRFNRAMAAFDSLVVSEKEPNWIEFMGNISRQYQFNKEMSIKQVKVVFWRLGKHKLNYHASDFVVRFDIEEDKDTLREMKPFQLDSIMLALPPQAQAFVRIMRRETEIKTDDDIMPPWEQLETEGSP